MARHRSVDPTRGHPRSPLHGRLSPGSSSRGFRPTVAGRGLLVVVLGLLAGCDDGTGSGPRGDVRGSVTVEGVSLAGVTVELTGRETQSITTDGAGGYEFGSVPAGAYVVSIRDLPDDASFPATSRTAVVSGSHTETVDFTGNFIRTASIGGTVLTGARGLGGVTVLLTGSVSRSAITDANGTFRFSGLRSGDYRVEISGFPHSVVFFVTQDSPHISTGETHLVTFEGRPQLTASATIRSILRRLPTGTTEPADALDLRGPVEITISVDRGEDTLKSLKLFLGETLVGQQLFDVGGAPSEPHGVEADGVSAPFDVVFLLGTAAFDTLSGAVRFTNGPRLLRVSLATVEGGPNAWQSTVSVNVRNQNTVMGTLATERGPVVGVDGKAWVGGAIALNLQALLYDPSTPIASVTVDLQRTGGAQLRVRTVEGSAPLQVLFAGSGTPDVGNVSGYQTPIGQSDQLRVLAARTESGAALPGFPMVLASELRIDNVAPIPGGFRLPQQTAGVECCLNNWVGSAFQFASGLDPVADAGVGGTSASVHAGPADATDAQIVALSPVSKGGDLVPTDRNSVYRAVARFRDILGNEVLVPLSPSEGNPISNARGAIFGVDAQAPQLAFGPQGVPDRATNPAAGAAWLLFPTEGLSGLGPLAARTRVLRRAPGIEGGVASCPFPAMVPCVPGRDGLQRDVPEGLEGYLTIESYVLDRAGNRSNTVARTVLRDGAPPVVRGVQLPAVPVAGVATPFSAQVSDNVDLAMGTIGLRFDAPGQGVENLTFNQAARLGDPFSGQLTTDATLNVSFPMVVAVERAEAGADQDGPTGILLGVAGARVRVRDAAGSSAATTDGLPPAGGSSPRSFSVLQRGDAGGVRGWQLIPQGGQVCRVGPAGACPSGVPATVRLVATARGREGVFARPFDRVHFYVVRDGEVEWIGSSTAPTVAEGSGDRGRSWSWELVWIPGVDMPAGTATLRAVGVDGGGSALLTRAVASVTVVPGS
ncbi:MAG: carboxypeptidase regulatory-like domain-containing protein [Gemmatimonadetes bacterium]|nr:carboxypeptidase regulatory-like domain-containing protein [Gemmatimonadota bacterium]